MRNNQNQLVLISSLSVPSTKSAVMDAEVFYLRPCLSPSSIGFHEIHLKKWERGGQGTVIPTSPSPCQLLSTEEVSLALFFLICFRHNRTPHPPGPPHHTWVQEGQYASRRVIMHLKDLCSWSSTESRGGLPAPSGQHTPAYTHTRSSNAQSWLSASPT